MKKNIAIIGAGISGISMARMLADKAKVTVFEQKTIGGLIKCDRVEDILYHRVGGHVFNSKNDEVLDWFWGFFDKEADFIKAKRFAQVYFEGNYIGYPIENHLYQLNKSLFKQVVDDLVNLSKQSHITNFEDFLLGRFGKTLYEVYFKPYNTKIWNTDLSKVPLDWLEGKLPMPKVSDIFVSNILRNEEAEMVHSTFFYPKVGGSQFIINKLATGLSIVENFTVESIHSADSKTFINGEGPFDEVIYTGDVRMLPDFIKDNTGLVPYKSDLKKLQSNGTTNILCTCDSTDLSWLYIPEDKYKAHRIIYTGNFSATNNGSSTPTKRSSCTVEFSNYADIEAAKAELKNLPGNLEFISYNYEPNSYIIQDEQTRGLLKNVKDVLKLSNIYLLGRFAEWEYYNMDKCIEAAMELDKVL
jgi:protoporphyrinogen oxidase